MSYDPRRSIANIIAFQLYGLPYIWGGDDPILGFDCSGFCVEILKSSDVLPAAGDWTAQGLYKMFKDKAVNQPKNGCLVFFGRDTGSITHVGFCYTKDFMFEADGGRSSTTSEEIAAKQNAYIRIRPISMRKDLVAIVDPFLS